MPEIGAKETQEELSLYISGQMIGSCGYIGTEHLQLEISSAL